MWEVSASGAGTGAGGTVDEAWNRWIGGAGRVGDVGGVIKRRGVLRPGRLDPGRHDAWHRDRDRLGRWVEKRPVWIFDPLTRRNRAWRNGQWAS